ncbi:unnamed protein product [Darwinula stevensoni]|uniref:Uncharacterized protein n=1 Tax=Darwinula stevensoni TaxID=69355 RepID=A0A7R9FNK0_9CRUS|nr:unnamed protein product [Darwinula stevensoni]CAG0896467.1 unnamed protein product [Darwinula stevensoni]
MLDMMEGKKRLSPSNDGKILKDKGERVKHNCEDLKILSGLRPLEKAKEGNFFKEDPRKNPWMRVRLAGHEDLPFCDAAEKYQKEYYPEAEERAYSFPAGYVLKGKIQEELFHELETSEPANEANEEIKIKSDFTAEAEVFDCLKEELAHTPSFITCGYDFNSTFYKAMGIAGKWTKKGEERWKRKGFDILRGELDVCGIFFDGRRVVVLSIEVKSIKQTDNHQVLRDRVGGAVGQLKKCEQFLQQIIGAMSLTDIFFCSFVALPYVSRRDVALSLKCDCHLNILTKDDLESRTAFREFLWNEERGITLTQQGTTYIKAKQCYLDVMRTFVAASVTVEEMPRTIEELHENIDKWMQRALFFLTPHQKQILKEDRSVLFLVGGQGTGKTYLLLNRAKQLAEKGEKVTIVNMSEGKLTTNMKKWCKESQDMKDFITVMDYKEFLATRQSSNTASVFSKIKQFFLPRDDVRGTLLEKINAQIDSHVLIDEMQINFGMVDRDVLQLEEKWMEFMREKQCRSLWIAWRPSDTTYSEILDIHRIVNFLGREKVEMLKEMKRSTKELGEFVIEVTLFIQKRFPCFTDLPMQGLDYGLHGTDDSNEEKPLPGVVFVLSPPTEYEVYRWASEAIMAIQSISKQSSSGVSQDPMDESSYEKISWTDFLEENYFSLPDFKSEEWKIELIFGPNRSGKTAFLFDKLKKKAEEGNEEMRKSGETSCRRETLEKSKRYEKWGRKHRIMFVDCSRWARTDYPPSLSLVDVKERMKSTEILNVAGILTPMTLDEVVDVCDVYDLIQLHVLGTNVSLSPQVIKELMVRLLENDDRGLHIAFDDVPIHGYVASGDTDSLRVEWENIISALSSHSPLASLTIAFHPYIDRRHTFNVKEFKKEFQPSSPTNVRILQGCQDANFPLCRLLHRVLSHESSAELQVKPATLNTQPQPSSLVFGVRPTLVTPPIGLHYHGRWKCIGGQGRGCVAITAAAFFLSQPHGDVVVLVSDEEIQKIFAEALGMMDSASGSTSREAPQIFQVKDYRGCEYSHVMCVGVEDTWMVEGISRAIQTLYIVDGGTSAAVQSRMGLWMEMERRGLLLHRPLQSSNALESLSDENWKSLNRKSLFLKIPQDTCMDETGRTEISSLKGAMRIFALGTGEDGLPGMWEVSKDKNNSTLWVHEGHSAGDVFLPQYDMLIHGAEGEVRILHLDGKDAHKAPYSWDQKLTILPPFIVDGTMGVGTWDSLFLLGGEKYPCEGRRLDLDSGTWMDLPKLTQGRQDAALVMLDHNNILVLGGWDPQKKKQLSGCERLDVRMRGWLHFPQNLPLPVVGHAATLYDDHVYISGGFRDGESRGKVWRCRVNGESPWDTLLPSLQFKRHNHGMVEDGAGGLEVIGGNYERAGGKSMGVLSTENLTLDEGRGWESKHKLPFIKLWKASSMKFISGRGSPSPHF